LGPGANKTAKSPDGWSHCEQIPQELSRHFPITPASSNKKSLAAWACRQAAPSKAGRRSGLSVADVGSGAGPIGSWRPLGSWQPVPD
jgi:hypothetical protein